MRILKIVWLTPFPLERLKQYGVIHPGISFKSYHPVTWIDVMLDELKTYENIRLTVITTVPNKYKCTRLHVIDKNIELFLIPVGLPFIKKSYPSRYDMNLLLNYPIRSYEINRIIKEINPDLVNVFGTENEYSHPGIKIKSPKMLNIQGLLGCRTPKTFFDRIKIRNEHWAIRNTRYFMSSDSQFIENYILNINPLAEFCKEDFPVSNIAFQINPSSKKYDVILAGGISESKGAEDFIKTISIIKNRNPGVKALMIGRNNPEYLLVLKQLNEKHNLTDNIEIKGYIDKHEDVFNLIAQSKVFCLPSHFDTGPRALAESMAIGVPVVTYNIMGISDMIKHMETGILVEENNIEGLADGINTLLDDIELYSFIVQKAKDFARQTYLSSNVVSRLVQYYWYIINQGKHST